MGKTRACLHAFHQGMEEGPRVMVVVTKKITKTVWWKEAEEMGIGYPVIRLFGQKKRYAHPEGIPAYIPRVFVLNWEILPAWMHTLQAVLKKTKFILVLDEPDEYLTNPASSYYKSARQLALMADRTWELTATLYRKNALDIYWQARMLGGRANPFQYWSVDNFGTEFCEARWNPWRGRIERDDRGNPIYYQTGKPQRSGAYDYVGLRPGAEEDLLHQFSSISKLMEDQVRGVALPIRIPQWLDEGEGFDPDYTDVRLEQELIRMIPLKIKLTLEFLENLKNRPIVVFGWNVAYTEGVARALNAPLIHGQTGRRDEILADFAARKTPILVGNLKSLARGIDLAVANHTIFGQPYWDAALLHQAERRMRGPKQKADHVVHHHLLVANSAEEYVWATRLKKGRAIDRLDKAGRELEMAQ